MPFTRPSRLRAVATLAAGIALTVGVAACGTSTSSGGSSTTTGSSSPAPATSSTTASAPAGTGTGTAGATTHTAQVGFTTYTSTKSFNDTISALKKATASNGMMILGDMNQAGALASTGLNLKGAHTFFIGNPVKGKMLFSQDLAVGAVIPLRLYVWVDSAGATKVGYFDPAAQFTAVDPTMGMGGQQMAKAAGIIAAAATGGTATPGKPVATTFVSTPSNKSFNDTVNALKSAVAGNGMMVLGDINQAAMMTSTGMNLKGAHAFFIGSPVKGKMFFSQDPAIGAVVPVGMFVWADATGKAHVGYFDPAREFTAVNPKLTGAGQQMAKAAAMISQAATR